MKRGAFSTIAVVLIILIVAIFFAIVWVLMVPASDVGFENLTDVVSLWIVANESSTFWDGDNQLAEVRVGRGFDDVEIIGFGIVFSIGGNSVTHYVEDVLGVNSRKTYYVNLSGYFGELDSIKLVPVFPGGILGSIVSELKYYVSNSGTLNLEGGFVAPVTSVPGGGGGGSSSSTTLVVEDPVVEENETNCTENWSCSDWSDCVADLKTRSCSDSNSCGTFVDRPVLSEGCVSADCVVDDDCDAGEYCNSGNCVPVGSECVEDSDCVYRGPGFVCNSGSECEWDAPIGIPVPSFGIEESYRMYDLEENRNPALTYTVNSEGGYYTHYVDNSGSCSDSGNGTEVSPRCTVPRRLVEGSVVEVHGGPYIEEIRGTMYTVDRFPFQGFGIVARPVFFRGDNENKPVIASDANKGIIVEGTYIIIENMEFNNNVGIWPRGLDGDITHHVSIRYSDFHKEEIRGNGVSIGWPHGDLVYYQDSTLLTDVVVYNNTIHDFGKSDWLEWGWETDPKDSLGVYIHHNAYKTWVLDNHIYNIDGDCIHANAYHIDDATQFPPTLTYIGRNDLYHARENAIDTKVAYDTIVSQNKIHNIRNAPGSDGTCIVIQTEHETVGYPMQERPWYLFNEVYDCDQGFRVQLSNNVYLIGNLIHDIISTQELRDSLWSSGCAIGGWTTRDVNIYNNVIYNTDLGILNAANRDYSEVHIANNIIFNLTDNFYELFGIQPYQIGIGDQAVDISSASNNLYYQNGGALAIRWGGIHNSVSAFQTATGQGQGSIEAGPQFINTDPLSPDFLRPSSTSPVIDAGSVSEVYQTFYNLYGINISKDIEEKMRPQGSGWDIGAYEYS